MATALSDEPESTTTNSRTSAVVTLLCWIMVVIEGYDQICYGTVIPALVNTPGSGFTSVTAGVVGSAGFAGMLVGGLGSGWLSDRIGRRPVAIAALIWFSVFTAICGAADGPVSLGLLRLLAGIGLGAIIPAASALTMEYATARHRTLAYTLMLSGVPVGGVLAALIAIPVLPGLGWRFMFVIAVVPAVIALPFVWRLLPESVVFLVDRGRIEPAAATAGRLGIRLPSTSDRPAATEAGLFRRGYLAASLLFAAATFFGLLAWYGLSTWLPGIMRATGYDLGSALLFLVVLNLGAVAGSLFIAVATDRWGNKLVVVSTYLVMTVALLALLSRLPQPPLLVAIAIAGVGGHGGQILVNAFVGRSYPAVYRARALGWSLGVGRTGTILGPSLIGWIVSGHNAKLGFVVFATAAFCAALLLLFVPTTPTLRDKA